MQVQKFIGATLDLEDLLSRAFAEVGDRHQREADIRETCKMLALWSRQNEEMLRPMAKRYGKDHVDEPQYVRSALFHGTRMGALGLLRDLSDLQTLCARTRGSWTILHQCAQALRDEAFEAICTQAIGRTDRQASWLTTRIKHVAAQALVVPTPQADAEVKASLPKRPTPATTPAFAWGPVAGGAAAIGVGLLGVAAGQPWLLPSLGPTAYLQAENPAHPSARPYNTVVGHAIGFGAGIAAVRLLGVEALPKVLTSHVLTAGRVWASVLGLAIAIFVSVLARASHPPAGATTLLVTLGGLSPTWRDARTILIGAALIAAIGEVLRQTRLRAFVSRLKVAKDKRQERAEPMQPEAAPLRRSA